MTPDTSNSEGPRLSARQQAALPFIAASSSPKEAALNSNISVKTLRRWMEDDEFREALEEIQQQAAELASFQLQSLMLQGAAILSQAMMDPNPALRLRAAQAAFVYGSKLGQDRKLKEEIQSLSDALPLWAAQQASL